MTDDGGICLNSQFPCMCGYAELSFKMPALINFSRSRRLCPMAYLLRQPIHLAYSSENSCVFSIL